MISRPTIYNLKPLHIRVNRYPFRQFMPLIESRAELRHAIYDEVFVIDGGKPLHAWPCTHEGVQNGKTSMRMSMDPSEQRYEEQHNISSILLFFLEIFPITAFRFERSFK